MSHQFIPSVHDRGPGRPSSMSPSSLPPSLPNDWRAQQSLFMGSTTPLYRRPVSLSPQDLHPVTHLVPSVFNYSTQQVDISSPSSGRVVYPSPVYHYGNPGYYYDPLQFPVSAETQTNPRYCYYPGGSVPTYTSPNSTPMFPSTEQHPTSAPSPSPIIDPLINLRVLLLLYSLSL